MQHISSTFILITDGKGLRFRIMEQSLWKLRSWEKRQYEEGVMPGWTTNIPAFGANMKVSIH